MCVIYEIKYDCLTFADYIITVVNSWLSDTVDLTKPDRGLLQDYGTSNFGIQDNHVLCWIRFNNNKSSDFKYRQQKFKFLKFHTELM